MFFDRVSAAFSPGVLLSLAFCPADGTTLIDPRWEFEKGRRSGQKLWRQDAAYRRCAKPVLQWRKCFILRFRFKRTSPGSLFAISSQRFPESRVCFRLDT